MNAVSLILFLCLALYLYARYIEPHLIVVRQVKINSGRNIAHGRALQIALLSDFHYPRCTSFGMVRRAIAKSNLFEPDVVLILGDFFARGRRDPTILPQDIKEVFSKIESRFGVFAVLGNHDHSFDEVAIRDRIASDTEIRLVDNLAVPLTIDGETVYIVGVGDLWSENTDYDRAVRNLPQDAAIILLSHNPDVIDDIRDPRILIQFSGHTHGGQVRLPIIGALRVPSKFGNKYCKGLITTGNHRLYVNSGICSMKKMRFMCPPEVTWVEMF